MTGTTFNVDIVNDRDILLHRSPLLGNGWLLDGQFDYLQMTNFPEQDLDDVFTLSVLLNVYPEIAGIITLLDTRNTNTNKGIYIGLDVVAKKINIQFFVSTSVYMLVEFSNIPFKADKRHEVVVCYDGSAAVTGITAYFDGVILKTDATDLTTFNTFGGVVIANNIPVDSTIVNGTATAYIGRKNTYNSPENSKSCVIKLWRLVEGIYTNQTSRKSFNTAISSLPNYLVDLNTDKVNGVPITDNENTVTINQFGGNTYTTFIS